MLTPAELDAPARLQYGPFEGGRAGADLDWSSAQEFKTLREALHVAMTREAPAGREPYLRLEDGRVLEPRALQALFDSLQGP
jgi:hypothetical protein